MLRHGLRALLANQPQLRVVGEVAHAAELLAQLPTTPADVVLLGLNLPSGEGVEIAGHLRQHYPAVQLLALGVLDAPDLRGLTAYAGARGYTD